MSAPPKVGIYFSHYECFGHFSVVMAIAEVFKKRFPRGDLFFIQAGLPQRKAKLDQMGVVYSLPSAFVGRRNFREPAEGAGTNSALRSKACTDILTREKPDLFITEFFPIGWEENRHELIPSLVKVSPGKAALWAVSGFPLITGKNYDWRDRIIKLYKRIIILSPVQEKNFIADAYARTDDRQRYLDFFERHKAKITFAGYHLPKQDVVIDDKNLNLSKSPVSKNACRVTVVRGGGAYYPKIIAEAILASELLGPDLYFTVVAGPSTTPKEWDLFSTLVARKKIKNVMLLRSAGNYEELIAKCDVCVSVASYNSAAMILKHRKKAVLIPFEGYEVTHCSEQLARARMLNEIIGSKILRLKDLTATALSEMILIVAGSKEAPEKAPEGWFKGGQYLDKAFAETFQGHESRF